MYYKINPSLDKEVVGKFFQSEKVLYTTDIDIFDQRLPQNCIFESVNKSVVVTPIPLMAQGARLTDLISTVVLGMQLVISDKLKNILQNPGDKNVLFFPLEIMYEDEMLQGFWLVHPVYPNMDVINYAASTVEVLGAGIDKLRDIKITDFENFKAVQSSLVWPEKLHFSKIVFRDDFCRPLVVLNNVQGGVGYYVSEETKKKIETAFCTGIVFTTPEERYP